MSGRTPSARCAHRRGPARRLCILHLLNHAVRVGRAPNVPTVGLLIAVLFGRHPGQDRFEGIDLEALAGEILLIKDPSHFAVDSGLFHVVAAAVVDDREDFEGEVFNLTPARESVRAAKFLIASEPAAYRGFGRHRGIGADGPETFAVGEPVADRFSDLGGISGRAAALGRVLGLHIAPPELLVATARSGIGQPGRARPSRLHISDDGLATIMDVDMLGPHVLIPTMTYPPKNLDLG